MIKVSRPTQAPGGLNKTSKKRGVPGDAQTELEWNQRIFEGDILVADKKMTFSRYKSKDVVGSLLSLFHKKCAYCESSFTATQPVDIEHYRPKGKVEGLDDHLGYWWLAADWENLLPSCIDCNRRRGQAFLIDGQFQMGASELAADIGVNLGGGNKQFAVGVMRNVSISAGKQMIFPLSDESKRVSEPGSIDLEEPLLLDPCRDQPDQHLEFVALPYLDTQVSIVTARELNDGSLDRKGIASILVYGLNRLELVQERTKVLRDLEFLFDLYISLAESKSSINKTKRSAVNLISNLDEEILRQKDWKQLKKFTRDDAENIVLSIEKMMNKIEQKVALLAGSDSVYSRMVKAWIMDNF